MKKFKILFLYFFISLIIVSNAFCSQMPSACEKLTDEGKALLNKGDFVSAINYFCRAFLIDSYETGALNQLLALRDNPKLPFEIQNDLLVLEDLLSVNTHLTSEVVYFRKKVVSLIKELEESGFDKTYITKKLDSIKSEINTLTNQPNGFENENQPLKILIESLNIKKENTSVLLTNSQNQFKQLKEIYKSELNKPIVNQVLPLGASSSVNQKIADIKESQELFLAHNKLIQLEEKINEKNIKIQNLKEQVVASALRKSEEEDAVLKKITEYSKLNNKYADLESRFELSQKIIAEKDEEIRNLNNQISDNEKEIRQSNSFLGLYEEKLSAAKELVLLKNNILDNLNNEIISSQNELKVLQDTLASQENQIQVLKQSLADAHLNELELNQNYAMQLNETNNNMKQLEGMLEIYKWKLQDSSKTVKDNNSLIYNLGQYVGVMQTQLNEKDKILEQTKDEISIFKEELNNVKKELQNLKVKSQQSYKDEKIDDDFTAIQSKLKDIHYFLSNKIEDFSNLMKSANKEF